MVTGEGTRSGNTTNDYADIRWSILKFLKVGIFLKNTGLNPLIYKVEEGKYIIDLASTLKQNVKDLREIKDPDEK